MQRILDCLSFGRSEKSYHEDIRSFCLTLHFYSPRAYSYVRSKFNNNLPSISTIRNWYSSLNASPGFTMESFGSLRNKVNELNKETGDGARKKLSCCLLCDEMAIRRHVQFNPVTKKFDGFIDIGRPLPDQSSLPVAKDALVYMISGLTDDFKIPIGYFFANGLNADERAALTNEALIRLYEIDIEVVAMNLDGLPANIAMYKLLGANFDAENAYFPHPSNPNQKIFALLDPPHMLKLIRNCVGTRNLVDGNGGIIQWNYFEMLYQAQKSLPWNLANKITKAHMDWQKQKMSVKLAAQIFSNSTADALEFMKGECSKFIDVDATVKFVRIINDIFDIMNSTKKSHNATGFKAPISVLTHEEMFQRFDEAEAYFIGLSVEGETKSIFNSTVSTGFFGFYHDMMNFRRIFNEYVRTEKIDVLITHRFSQDLIETFFGSIRSMGGKFLKIIDSLCNTQQLNINAPVKCIVSIFLSIHCYTFIHGIFLFCLT